MWRKHRAEYEALRKAHAAPQQSVVPLETARARRTPIEWRAEDLPAPEFTGVRVLDDFPLATLREFIDWTPFFHTWELKGVYPRILEDETAGRAGAADFCGSECAAGSDYREEAADGARRVRVFSGERVWRRCGAVRG